LLTLYTPHNPNQQLRSIQPRYQSYNDSVSFPQYPATIARVGLDRFPLSTLRRLPTAPATPPAIADLVPPSFILVILAVPTTRVIPASSSVIAQYIALSIAAPYTTIELLLFLKIFKNIKQSTGTNEQLLTITVGLLSLDDLGIYLTTTRSSFYSISTLYTCHTQILYNQNDEPLSSYKTSNTYFVMFSPSSIERTADYPVMETETVRRPSTNPRINVQLPAPPPNVSREVVRPEDMIEVVTSIQAFRERAKTCSRHGATVAKWVEEHLLPPVFKQMEETINAHRQISSAIAKLETHKKNGTYPESIVKSTPAYQLMSSLPGKNDTPDMTVRQMDINHATNRLREFILNSAIESRKEELSDANSFLHPETLLRGLLTKWVEEAHSVMTSSPAGPVSADFRNVFDLALLLVEHKLTDATISASLKAAAAIKVQEAKRLAKATAEMEVDGLSKERTLTEEIRSILRREMKTAFKSTIDNSVCASTEVLDSEQLDLTDVSLDPFVEGSPSQPVGFRSVFEAKATSLRLDQPAVEVLPRKLVEPRQRRLLVTPWQRSQFEPRPTLRKGYDYWDEGEEVGKSVQRTTRKRKRKGPSRPIEWWKGDNSDLLRLESSPLTVDLVNGTPHFVPKGDYNAVESTDIPSTTGLVELESLSTRTALRLSKHTRHPSGTQMHMHRQPRNGLCVSTPPDFDIRRLETYPDGFFLLSDSERARFMFIHSNIYWLETRVTNNVLQNPFNIPLDESTKRFLALNSKFCPKPRYEIPQRILHSWEDFSRSVRIRCLFSDKPDDMDFVAKFHIKTGTSIGNLENHPDVEEGLRVGKSLLQSALRKIQTNDWRPSISSERLEAFDQLIHHNDYIFKPCDKNLGMSILPSSWYVQECKRQLSDLSTYELATVDVAALSHRLIELTDCSTFTKQARKFVRHTLIEPALPEFYVLPKVHKQPIRGRPIVPSHKWITTNLSKWLDYQLRPFLSSYPWILRDSKTLLRHLDTLALPTSSEKIWLLTADMTSFYSSIPTDEGIKIIRWMASIHKRSDDDADVLGQSLEFILKNNYLAFGSSVYRQVNGTAMGTACAPAFANLYAAAYESLTLDKKPPSLLYYGRYLDDILVIVKGSIANVEHVKTFVNHTLQTMELSWTVSPTSLPFLDITLQVDEDPDSLKRSIVTSVYQKPSNAYQYIPWSSYHPPKVKLAFVKGELVRYARICSTKAAFSKVSLRFYERLRARGYPPGWLRIAFRTVRYADRRHLLVDRPKRPSPDKPPLVFHAAYNPIWEKLRMKHAFNALLGISNAVSKQRFLGKRHRPLMCFHRVRNLGDRLNTANRKTIYRLEGAPPRLFKTAPNGADPDDYTPSPSEKDPTTSPIPAGTL
ncbi:reverse transcriptase, partial [Puccinia sorghi]